MRVAVHASVLAAERARHSRSALRAELTVEDQNGGLVTAVVFSSPHRMGVAKKPA